MNDMAHGAPVSTYSMHKQLQLVGAMDMIYRYPVDYIHNAAASVDCL